MWRACRRRGMRTELYILLGWGCVGAYQRRHSGRSELHLDVEERVRIQRAGQERAFQNNMSKVTDVRGLGEVLLGEDTQGPVGNEVLKEGWVQVIKIIPLPPLCTVLSTLCVQFNLILLIISIFQNWGWRSAGPRQWCKHSHTDSLGSYSHPQWCAASYLPCWGVWPCSWCSWDPREIFTSSVSR